MRRLIDASVLVAAYSKEQRSTEAIELLTAEPLPVVSVLALAETQISLIRKRKRGDMQADEVQRARAMLQQTIDGGLLELVPLPEGVWDMAVAIADRVAVHLRTQDAAHAATAKSLGLCLATFDTDLAVAAEDEGIDVVH